MKRIHAAILAVALGVAVVLGSFAALRTTHAASAPTADSTQIAKQNRALDRVEAALRAELRRKPPAVGARPAANAGPAQTVIYHRPPPVVHVLHRSGEHESDGRDGGEGLDD